MKAFNLPLGLHKTNIETIESFFTVMRMSYANVRAEFFQLLLDMPNSGICYNHARNFYAVMEFFIPLVGLLF